MAKSKAKPKVLQSVTVTYDLFQLPTAQHKAGLAGLILQIRSMHERHRPQDTIPVVDVLSTSATVTFTEKSVQGLFDDFYDAQTVEVAVRSKWPGRHPKGEKEVEEIDEEGKPRKAKRFLYDVIQPCGHF